MRRIRRYGSPLTLTGWVTLGLLTAIGILARLFFF